MQFHEHLKLHGKIPITTDYVTSVES